MAELANRYSRHLSRLWSGAGAWLRRNWFVLLAGLLAALPVLLTTGQAIDARWTPSSDDGIIALRAFDVLGDHPPLVGQYSQTSPLIGHPTYSLGPMLYWVLAIPARLGGAAMVLTMGVISAACVMGVVALAHRRGGRELAVAAALGMVLLNRSVPVEVPYEVWNCWAGLYPFALLLFLSWSVACGDFRLIPLLVIAASYVIQAHFAYFVPAACAVGVAIVGLAEWLPRERPRERMQRWAAAALVVGLVCWSAPLIDEVTNRPGNLVRAFQLATNNNPRRGFGEAWYADVRAIGVVPWWAERSRTPTERLVESATQPSAGAIATAILVVAGLLGALILSLRGRRHDITAATALALLLCLAMLVFEASVPSGSVALVAFSYPLTWMWPAGMFMWLTLGWSVWALARPIRRRVDVATLDLRRRAPALVSLTVVVTASAVVTDRWDEDLNARLPPGLKDYRLIRDTTARVRSALADSPGVRIRVPISVENSLTFQSAIAYVLRRDGIPVALPRRLVKEAGASYSPSSVSYEAVLWIRNGDARVPSGSELLVRNPEVSVARTSLRAAPAAGP
jgi:hypothetical protein